MVFLYRLVLNMSSNRVCVPLMYVVIGWSNTLFDTIDEEKTNEKHRLLFKDECYYFPCVDVIVVVKKDVNS